MANSYSTTSFSLRGTNGGAAIIGPFGQLMIDSVIREGWFTNESGEGLYEYIGDQDDVIGDLVHDLPGETPDNLEEALRLYQSHHPEQINEAMLEKAKEFDLERGGFSEVIDLIRLEPGSDIHELAEESGYWCDKNRHGQFGGYGWYWSPAFAMGLSSQFVVDLGTKITKAAAKKDASEIAKLLLDRLVQPATDRLPPDLRKQVLAELEGMRQNTAAQADPDEITIRVKRSALRGAGNTLFLVSGREPGDDDDTAQLILSDSAQAASALYEKIINEDSSEEELDSLHRSHGTTAFINVCTAVGEVVAHPHASPAHAAHSST